MAPLTYTFRLFINEEFNECAKESSTPEPTTELLGCLNVMQESGFTLGSTDGQWYTDNSTYVFPQYGKFTGRNSINEYLSLNKNLFSNLCATRENSAIVDFVPQPGYCDLTIGNVVRTTINPLVTNYQGFLEGLFGWRLQFPMPTDAKALEIDTISAYYPNDFIRDGLSESYDLTKSVNRICTVMQNNCKDVFEANGYKTFGDCTEELSLLPRRIETPDGIMYDDGNSTGCRILHSFLATESDVHCPHLSYLPIEDVNGYTKCSESAYLNVRDYFSEASFEGFERVREKHGFHGSDRSYSFVEESDVGQCVVDGIEDDLRLSMLPSSCEIYVSAQKSTDSYRGQYWSTLIGILFGMRIVGMILLKMRVKNF